MAAIIAAAASPLTWLVAPMSSLTAVRDPLVPTGMPWVTPDVIWATPNASSSWLASTTSWWRAAKERAVRMESEKATRKMATAPVTSVPRSARETSGTANDGSPLGTGPVTDTPWDARSSAQDAAMPRTTSTSAPGMRLLILASHDEEHQRQRADHDRRGVGVAEVAHDVDRLADGAVLVAGDTDQLAELTEDQHDGDSGDVPDQDRLREVVGDPAQAHEPGREEHETHQQGQHRCQRGVLRAPARRKRGDRRRDEQRDGALRPDDHPRRGPEDGIRQDGQQQRVQSGADRNAGQLAHRPWPTAGPAPPR